MSEEVKRKVRHKTRRRRLTTLSSSDYDSQSSDLVNFNLSDSSESSDQIATPITSKTNKTRSNSQFITPKVNGVRNPIFKTPSTSQSKRNIKFTPVQGIHNTRNTQFDSNIKTPVDKDVKFTPHNKENVNLYSSSTTKDCNNLRKLDRPAKEIPEEKSLNIMGSQNQLVREAGLLINKQETKFKGILKSIQASKEQCLQIEKDSMDFMSLAEDFKYKKDVSTQTSIPGEALNSLDEKIKNFGDAEMICLLNVLVNFLSNEKDIFEVRDYLMHFVEMYMYQVFMKFSAIEIEDFLMKQEVNNFTIFQVFNLGVFTLEKKKVCLVMLFNENVYSKQLEKLTELLLKYKEITKMMLRTALSSEMVETDSSFENKPEVDVVSIGTTNIIELVTSSSPLQGSIPQRHIPSFPKSTSRSPQSTSSKSTVILPKPGISSPLSRNRSPHSSSSNPTVFPPTDAGNVLTILTDL